MEKNTKESFLGALIGYFLRNKLIVGLFILFCVTWGISVAPFDYELKWLPRDPVPVDAIPDISENQQIVFTRWPGRSPQDIEDQITYPLTVALLGIPKVKTIRSYSYLGYSSIYVIFNEDADFYWSRTRILEKIASLPSGTLPPGISPALGPDATALGEIFWYTLEGRDEKGNLTGGWDLDELRSIQDYFVRYALQGAEGVSEVASIGGFVREYQVDVDPNAMRAYGITMPEVIRAVRQSNLDIGARTIEVNGVEYVVRGLGFIKSLKDLEQTAVKSVEGAPVQLKQIAKVTYGPALRRGALDKDGVEAVGGVVIARYGKNPLSVIKAVKEKIKEISVGLPEKILPDGRKSKVTIVPFYDRTGLIYETLGTLNRALYEEVLVSALVIVLMVFNLRTAGLVTATLPFSILICFIFMKIFQVDANIVALSGIAIAIGTMADIGIVFCENILNYLKGVETTKERLKAVRQATVEVASAVMTAVATTVISFLPVFTMEAAEGKLFRPLAFTKTFALIAALLTSLLVLPAAAHLIYRKVNLNNFIKIIQISSLVILSALCLSFRFYIPSFLFLIAVFGLLKIKRAEAKKAEFLKKIIFTSLTSLVLVYLIAFSWMPLGLEKPVWLNFILVGTTFGVIMGAVFLFQLIYTPVLSWALKHKVKFLTAPIITVTLGVISWQSLGKEFMPALDEGSFLLMPSTTPHAAISESKALMRKIDAVVKTIPEVDSVVGKLGRVDSALDPAPISMYENIVNYKSEYIVGKDGHPLRFKYDYSKQEFVRDKDGKLITDPDGMPFRQWRKHIRSPDDIWREIVDKISSIKGITIPPKLQPIETRVIMLQTGMRAPIGIKIKGPDLKTIEKVGIQLERLLKNVPSINPKTVNADRITSKPYLEIAVDREKIARYGLAVKDVLDVIEVAIGGKPITVTVEGRERYPVRVRYLRELRDSPETLTKILIPAKLQMRGKMAHKVQVPLAELGEVKYVPKSQVIKSEDTFLVGYLVFDKNPGWAEVDVVEQAQKFIQQKIKSGEFKVPKGVTLTFAGNYENQIRAEKKLMVVVPIALFVIFLILYFQFNSSLTAAIVFSGILVAWAGGFILLWCYNQPWFMNISLFGYSFREIFNIKPYNLSTAVWVGFIALFGIASDNGVLIATLIKQRLDQTAERSVEIIREAVLTSAKRRIRPALMTTAATMLALMPVLTSTGRGSDIMVPMAIPSFGGVLFSVITLFVVPVLYSWAEEIKLKFLNK